MAQVSEIEPASEHSQVKYASGMLVSHNENSGSQNVGAGRDRSPPTHPDQKQFSTFTYFLKIVENKTINKYSQMDTVNSNLFTAQAGNVLHYLLTQSGPKRR
jgi:hypothetical protein